MLDINWLQIKKINAEKNKKSLTFKIKTFSLLLEKYMEKVRFLFDDLMIIILSKNKTYME